MRMASTHSVAQRDEADYWSEVQEVDGKGRWTMGGYAVTVLRCPVYGLCIQGRTLGECRGRCEG
jgi:hypothetical protein